MLTKAEIDAEIDSVDHEIAELEELISLQRLKVQLLRNKSNILISGNQSADSTESNTSTTDTARDINNVSSTKSNNIELTETTSFASRHSGSALKSFSYSHHPDASASSSESKTERLTIHKPPPTDVLLSPKTNSILTSMNNQSILISSVQRMSRLTTDLANERNLLAWGRTAMAAVRTALAFLALSGVTEFGDGAVRTVAIG